MLESNHNPSDLGLGAHKSPGKNTSDLGLGAQNPMPLCGLSPKSPVRNIILAAVNSARPHPILTEVPSNPCDHNDPTSEPNR